MSREELASALASALNLLNSLDNGEWSEKQNLWKRKLQDSLPEVVDEMVTYHTWVRPEILLAATDDVQGRA